MSDRRTSVRKPVLAHISITGGDTLAMNLEQPPHLLSPWLRRGSVALLHAQPKTGKTYLALNIALAVTTGDALLGWKPDRPGKSRRVLYIDAEMPLWLMQKRLKQLQCDEDNHDIHILSREQVIAANYGMPDLGSAKGQDELNTFIDHMDPDLIVLDSLSALIRSGTENERESWLPIEAWLQRQRALGRAVLMVHHQGKSGLQRGTSSRMEVLDAELSLKKAERGALELTIERIRDHDGPIGPALTLRLDIADGAARWRNVTRNKDELGSTRKQVLALMKKGNKPSHIAKLIKKSRATVNEHARALQEKGLIRDVAA